MALIKKQEINRNNSKGNHSLDKSVNQSNGDKNAQQIFVRGHKNGD
jgi:hypothetical protein